MEKKKETLEKRDRWPKPHLEPNEFGLTRRCKYDSLTRRSLSAKDATLRNSGAMAYVTTKTQTTHPRGMNLRRNELIVIDNQLEYKEVAVTPKLQPNEGITSDRYLGNSIYLDPQDNKRTTINQ